MPITRIALFLLCTMSTVTAFSPQAILVINPGISTDTTTSQETYEWALAVKHELQKKMPSLRIILSRGMYEKAHQQEIASCTNRLEANFFISLHLCKSMQARFCVFSYVHHPVTDYWYTQPTALALTPSNKAHIPHAKTSLLLSQKLVASLKKLLPASSLIEPACALPFIPLEGIQAPACALELSVAKPKEWRLYLAPVVESIYELITPLKIQG